MEFPKKPHTAIICGKTGCGKTHFILDLLDNDYNGVFENIFILCPTYKNNKTYLERKTLWDDPNIFFIDPTGKLHKYIETLSEVFADSSTLFIVDDMAGDQDITKKRQALTRLAFSGRHRQHSLWVLTQAYTSVLTDVRRQTEWIALFYCKAKKCFDTAMDENSGIDPSEYATIRAKLSASPYAKLVLKSGPPLVYNIY